MHIKIQLLKTVRLCDRLSVVQEIRLEAQQKGLTPEILEEILKDD
jgi:hypothetical protein